MKYKIEGIGINESIEFMLVKKFESNSTSNFPIQGFSIHLPRRGIDTYDGFLTFGVLVEDQVALEEKVNIKVDVVKTSLSIGLDKIIPAMSAIIAVFAVALFIFFRKKNARRLTSQLHLYDFKCSHHASDRINFFRK